jgi:hypothetical protein
MLNDNNQFYKYFLKLLSIYKRSKNNVFFQFSEYSFSEFLTSQKKRQKTEHKQRQTVEF